MTSPAISPCILPVYQTWLMTFRLVAFGDDLGAVADRPDVRRGGLQAPKSQRTPRPIFDRRVAHHVDVRADAGRESDELAGDLLSGLGLRTAAHPTLTIVENLLEFGLEAEVDIRSWRMTSLIIADSFVG